jgi:predicted nuclease with TOPRIM domain
MAVLLLEHAGVLWAADSVDTAGTGVSPIPMQASVQNTSLSESAQENPATDPMVRLQQTQEEIREKDALIARLSNHLESALTRLNHNSSPVSSSSVSALNEERAELERQNNILKVKQEELQSRVEELSKKSQLLDLENRQLYEALNGRPAVDKHAEVHTARNDTDDSKEKVVYEPYIH